MGSNFSDDVDFLKFAEDTLDFLLSKLHISKIIIFENLVQNVKVSGDARVECLITSGVAYSTNPAVYSRKQIMRIDEILTGTPALTTLVRNGKMLLGISPFAVKLLKENNEDALTHEITVLPQ